MKLNSYTLPIKAHPHIVTYSNIQFKHLTHTVDKNESGFYNVQNMMKSKIETDCSSLNLWQNMKFVILPRCGKSMKMTRKEKKFKKISRQTYNTHL